MIKIVLFFVDSVGVEFEYSCVFRSHPCSDDSSGVDAKARPAVSYSV